MEGTGTREWLFSYDFLGNNMSDIVLLDIEKDPFAAINCEQECRAWNWNGAAVNLSVRTLGYVIRDRQKKLPLSGRGAGAGGLFT